MKGGFALALGLMALSCVEAKNRYVVKEDATTKEHKRPKVEQSYTQNCYADYASFRLCAEYGTQVEIGWEWKQEFYQVTEADKYYSINLELYSSQQLNVEGEFYTDRLYSNVTDITLDRFQGIIGLQYKYYYNSGDGWLCYAGYYAIDDLVFEITTKQRFLEAHKNLITNLWSLD